jgi:predicted N-acetyltransferase YhbS
VDAITTIRKMTASDIPAGMRLCDLAGWNQVERDWQRFLELEPDGCFVAEQDRRVCATVTTLRYQNRFGWLGMLLTDPEARRQGLATRLLEQGCAYLDSAGVETVRLDGTPMGRSLYLQRGFVDEHEIQRWEGGSSLRDEPSLPPMSPSDVELVCAMDRRIFGADRSLLLKGIWRENPLLSAVVRQGAEIAGYILGREGSRARHLGPWIARSKAVAELLLRAVLSRFQDRPVFVDLCMKNPEATVVTRKFGFKYQRPLSRMYRGPNRYPGEPQFIFGIAGPELG